MSALIARLGGTRSSSVTARQITLLTLTLLLVIVLGAAPQWADAYGLQVGYRMAQVAALAQAWNLMAGYGGLVSLAVSAFVGVGSYAGAKLSIAAGFGFLPSTLAGGAFAAGFAVLVSVPMFRFRGLYFTIGSLVLASALAAFMVNWNGLGGASGLTLTDVAPTPATLYQTTLLVAVGATLAVVLMLRARLGLGLLAVRDDEDVAERMGVATFRTKLIAFALAGFIMGLVGALQAQKLGRIEPYGAFGLSWTIDSINAAIIGGVGTIVGPLLGAVLMVQIGEWLAGYPELHVALMGLLVILVIRFAPRGVWGTLLQHVGPRLIAAVPEWLKPRSAGVILEGRAAEPIAGASDPAAPAAPPAIAAESATATRAATAVSKGAAGPSGRGQGVDDVLLKATGVGKAFGGVKAVDAVDVDIRAGEVLGIVGPNGAGKSTLIGLLSGALRTDTGSVELFGEDATALGAQQRARMGVGRTHQIPRPFRQITVLENLLVAQMHGAGRSRSEALAEAERILRMCGLAEQAHVLAGNLTLLRLKRLEVARALSLNPRILLLDEVGAGLVEHEVRELIDLIGRLRGEVEAILVVEHVLDVIRECCDRLVVIDRGSKLTEGDPHEVLADPDVAAVYLGTSGGAEVHHARDRVGHSDRTVLEVSNVSAGYGAFKALHDVSLEVREGEVIALLGANGAGKTTTARVISGMVQPTGGEVRFNGAVATGRPGHEVVRAGVAHCMEGRRIFADLTVEENLLLGGRTAPSGEERTRRLQEVYELFDVLREKRRDSGASLSGGQQQMLAIGRALMAKPSLVIFDEISLGLAPIMVDRLYGALAQINARGVAMIVIEQNVERGLALADRVAVLEKGRIALSGTPEDLRKDPRMLALYVGEAKEVPA
jgi:ABC-type branched-subunit amino acid transport system ATPase component/ABC-type branched-subunit amino acid transport system permease subunit